MLKNWKFSKESRNLLSQSRTTICPSGCVFFVRSATDGCKETVKDCHKLIRKLQKESCQTVKLRVQIDVPARPLKYNKKVAWLQPKPESSTQSPGINLYNNDFPNLVGKNAKTSLLWIEFEIPIVSSVERFENFCCGFAPILIFHKPFSARTNINHKITIITSPSDKHIYVCDISQSFSIL